MTGVPLTLFHFLTFTFGFTAIILISRRSTDVSPVIRKTFINQSLLYNLTIITMTVVDITILLKDGSAERVTDLFVQVMANINNALYVLWCLSFVMLVYRFLEMPVSGRRKRIIWSVVSLLMLMVIYNLTGSISGDRFIMQKVTSGLLCFTPVSVLGYSLFLYRKASLLADPGRRKALRLFSMLFTGFSLLTLYYYCDTILFHRLPGLVNNLLIYLVDFTYNAIVVIWSIRYFEPAGVIAVSPGLKDLSCDQIVVRYQISKREQEIIQLVCSGRSNQEIADALFISLGTVKNHIYNIYTKLGVKNRTQLARLFGEQERQKVES